MKRRVYNPNNNASEKRKKLEEAALARLRLLRKKIDPELIERARRIIAKKAGEASALTSVAGADHYPADDAGRGGPPQKTGALDIDREKNISTVIKFMEMKKGDDAFKARLQAFLGKFT